MSYNRNTVRRARSYEDDDSTHDSSDDAGSDYMEEAEMETDGNEELLRYETQPVRAVDGAAPASAAAAAAADDDDDDNIADLRMIAAATARPNMMVIHPVLGVVSLTAPVTDLAQAAQRIADKRRDASARMTPERMIVERHNAATLRVLASFYAQPTVTPYGLDTAAVGRTSASVPILSTWPYGSELVQMQGVPPTGFNSHKFPLREYVQSQWYHAGLPEVQWQRGGYASDPNDNDPDKEHPWEKAMHQVRLGQNAVDLGRSFETLINTQQNPLTLSELRPIGRAPPAVIAKELFTVSSYVDRLAELEVLVADLSTAANRTHYGAGTEYPSVGTRCVTMAINGVDQMGPVQRAYAVLPIKPIDEELERWTMSALDDKCNTYITYQDYVSVYAHVEDKRQQCIAGVNQVMLSCIMEQAILYGPVMTMSRNIMPYDFRNWARTCMRYWHCGTVWLHLEQEYDTGMNDGVAHLLEFRRQSNTIIAENWARLRLEWLRRVTDYAADEPSPYETARQRLSPGARALKLSRRAFNVFYHLLPKVWVKRLESEMVRLRHVVGAPRYRPVMMQEEDAEEDDIVCYVLAGARNHATASAGAIPGAAKDACAIISLQAAATAFGTFIPFVLEGTRACFPPPRYDQFFARLFGNEILDIRREYRINPEDGDTLYGQYGNPPALRPMPSSVQHALLPLSEALHEVITLLHVSGDIADEVYDNCRSAPQTYAEEMYKLTRNERDNPTYAAQVARI